MVANDLATHHLVELVLEGFDFPRQLFQAGKRDHADLAVLERGRVAGVIFGTDPVQTQYFARHLEAGNLLAPVLEEHVGLE